MKKRYVTIFPECMDIHLKKDVGMLPLSLGKYENYDFSIVCYNNNDITDYNKQKYKIEFVAQEKNTIIDFSRYLLKHSKNIDILNLYHITSRRNIFWILIYKLLNHKGKVHIKLDADLRMIELINFNAKGIKSKLKNHVLKSFVDLYTVETTQLLELLRGLWNLDIELLPNGVFSDELFDPNNIKIKCNRFLTVGRLGTEQKATEVLLDAYKMIANKTDWDLYLVGPIEDSFQKHVEHYYKDNPELIDRVIFTGNISEQTVLANIYATSKVFILPSRWESFGLVLLEALEQGMHLIVTNQIPSIDDINHGEKYCSIVPADNAQLLADSMLKSINENFSDELTIEKYNFVKNNFSWEEIAKKLANLLENI